MLTRPGVGVLTVAELLGETADITRFRNKDAYARHTGAAPCRCGQATGHVTGSLAPATGN